MISPIHSNGSLDDNDVPDWGCFTDAANKTAQTSYIFGWCENMKIGTFNGVEIAEDVPYLTTMCEA